MGQVRDFIPFEAKRVVLVNQVDINSAAQGGNYNFVSMRNYQRCAIELIVKTIGGGTPALTAKQAKNVEGNGSKALDAFTRGFRNQIGASPQEESDMWEEFTIASGSVTLVANRQYFIPIKPEHLDATNNFDCLRPEISAATGATLVTCSLLFWAGFGGIGGNVKHIPSTAVNQMP